MASNGRWLHADIASMPYEEARRLQLALVETKERGDGFPDVIFFLEHPAVFTLGRRGGRGHLKVTEGFLRARGIPLIHTERGGEITYHGPGQLVCYPIVDFRGKGWKVVDFVGALEEVMIRTAREWGILAGRNALNRGTWVGTEKLGSVGIAVRRGISYHGFALNVNTDLQPFDWIDPCGLRGVRMTSMQRLLGEEVSMEEVRRAASRHAGEIFGAEFRMTGLDAVHGLLARGNPGPGRTGDDAP